MAVANTTITPLPVRWRFPQESAEEDVSLEQDSLGAVDFDSLQAVTDPTASEDTVDAWAPQRLADSPPRAPVFEMQHFSYGLRETRFDILKPNSYVQQSDRKFSAGSNYVHPAIYDQEKWEKHKQLIRDYFESQQALEEVVRRGAEWSDPALPVAPDWEPYRRALLPVQNSSCTELPQQTQGSVWTDALPPIREQPGEVGDGDDEDEEEDEDEDDEDGRNSSPSRDASEDRPGSRASSASPASARDARPTLQLVGVTLDSSSSDGDASVDSGHGASAASSSGAAGSPPRPPAPVNTNIAATIAAVAAAAADTAPVPVALRSHRKELSMDSGIQGSSCDLASGATSNASPAGSDAGADAAADLAAAAAAAASVSRRSLSCPFPPMLETDPEALLHGETFNLVEEVYVVGNPLAGLDTPRVARAIVKPHDPTAELAGDATTSTPAVAVAKTVASDAAADARPLPEPDRCPRHIVVVAIDFGTTYSGYAFCFTRDPELNIHMMRKWEGGDPGLNNQKTPTTLLLSPDEEFHSFGFAARDFFHDLDIQDAKKWLFFDKFKMALHHDQDMNRDTRVQAANGRSLPALTVFAHALRHLKQQALRELSDQAGADLRSDHIRWVVTVPAIWRQPAKQFIREAAYQAGICSPDRPEGLLIALEPEAASICCRKLRLNQLVPEARPAVFQPPPPPPLPRPGAGASASTSSEAIALVLQDTPSGMRYMVVDCGGGTVDITVHELSERCGTLRELHKATGGPWGSMGVDAEFERLLGEIFSGDFLSQFKAKRPASYTELMVSWEARKRSASPHRDAPLSVFPPFAFIDFYRKTKGKEEVQLYPFQIEQAVRKYGRKDVTWSSQGALRLQPNIMRELFQPTIQKILRYIQDVLDSPRVHGIEYLFLVGGFAESQLLQHEVRAAFSPRVRVVIPQGVALTTLRGAVLFGLEPGVVTVRRSKHTYGVGVLKPFQPGVHPPEKLVERDGVQWCADVLDKFVSVEQSVTVGEAVVRRYTPALAAQTSILINIYCADTDNAQFTTDPGVRRCGALRLDLSNSEGVFNCKEKSGGSSGRPREIHTRMVFGGTEITASALDLDSGSCVQADVDFLTL